MLLRWVVVAITTRYTFDMRTLKKAVLVHKDFLGAVMDVAYVRSVVVVVVVVVVIQSLYSQSQWCTH